MSDFYDDIKAEMLATVYNSSNDASELIEWWPQGVEGNKRQIYAVIDRPASALSGNVKAPVAMISVLNDSTNGVSSTEIDVGADKWKFSDRYGKTATAHQAKSIDTHDEAEIMLVF